MRLNTEDFEKKSKELHIPYKKYVNINAFQLEEISKNENFIKKEIVPTRTKFKKIGDNPSEEENINDTHYYFKEGEYVVILVDNFSNFEYHDDEYFQEKMGEIEEFIIEGY